MESPGNDLQSNEQTRESCMALKMTLANLRNEDQRYERGGEVRE
jgi:hypothetical protein